MKLTYAFIFITILSLISCQTQEPQINENMEQANEDTSRTQEPAANQKTNCPTIFTHEFTDFEKIDAFQPIGSITGASRGRSYITIKKGETVPVYAPTDATLISVIYAYRGPNADHGEYGFLFDTGCDINILLDHIDTISDEMKLYAPKVPARTTATDGSLRISIKGGTLLGYTDGTPQARTFDFLVLDYSKKASYINPERWKWEQSLYSVCPYDLYEEGLKERYYQKIGESSDTGFEKAQDCGHPSFDIPGTISGGWFLDQATDIKGEFLLVGERSGTVDITVKTDSEGTIMRISDYEPEILPKDIGIGDSVCYSGFNDWVYLRLIDSATIELINGNGACPSSFPTANSKKYYR